jgi:hypothetical protein
MGTRVLSFILMITLTACGRGKADSSPDTWTDPILDAEPDGVSDECTAGTG